MSGKRKGLGRGLDALLGGNLKESTADVVHAEHPNDNDQMRNLPVEFLQRGKYQPRRDMHPEALQELANSIRTQGVMQPIVVRPIGDNRYEIIAGERRWRAAQLAELDTIPAIIKDVPDEAAIAMALIENIQREDLNPIEEAVALDRLQREFSLTQQQVADAVGKSRAAVANLIRLLALEPEARLLLERGDLEMGHARALLALDKSPQIEAARIVASRGLTVRQTEALVKKWLAEPHGVEQSAPDRDISQLEDRIAEHVGLPVKVLHNANGKGKVTFTYSKLDELDGLLLRLKINPEI